ncbi:interferon regulatory factor 7 isoform X2 [Sceloporus undulatus]|uniref:interferon regulatory factor 7 isoform X2 n=1 Tax=Sceloporus undulatus TaxID=8520 RepID=UPI001C4BD8EF|nr:interferon regulatory factor 7 isoform X2 [Sceloporus undulatus]
MSATANKRNPQKICFFDWLINEINSRNYEGLYWVDEAHTTFRIPWKHNSRKDLVADDYMIFKAWAVVSKKYNEHPSDPSRWKTNFRCALKSTKRFEELKSNDPDYHEYRIIPLRTAPAAIPPGTRVGSDHGNDDLRASPASEGARGFEQTTSPFQEIDVAFRTLSLDNPVPEPNVNTAENIYVCSGDTLQWVLQQANLNMDGLQPVSWAPTSDDHLIGQVSYQQNSAYAVPHVDQNSYHHLRNEAMNEAVENSYYEEPSRCLAEIKRDVNSQSAATLALQQAQQNSPATNHLNHLVENVPGQNNCFIENVFMDEEPVGNGVMMCSTASHHPMMEGSICPLPAVPLVEQPSVNAAPLQNNTGPVSFGLDVSIYYRGRLLCETGVVASSCLFTYNNHDHTQVLDNPQIIQFPNPTKLPDQKQVQHTLTVLQNTGLLLYQQNKKLCAKRLGKCKVFWAFSKQLDNMAQHPEPKVLPREAEVEIFNYEKFCQELQQFRDGQRKSSPDYTIYLCFGQCFSVARPKESKLILVKLVPVFCKYWHERVLRDGVSSLNSEIESLQFSNSLFDMMEYLSNICMQSEVVH